MTTPGHIPVLPDQVLDLLAPRPGLTCLDGTLGRGGHAALLIPRLSPNGRYLGLDLDPTNLVYAHERLAPIAADADVELITRHSSFTEAPALLDSLDIDGIDLLLADLGFASTQMDDPSRGLSFQEDAPLDMRLDPTPGSSALTAADLLATLGERELADLIYELGEERLSRRIARKIVEQRQRQPIQSTRQLADLVRAAYGPMARRSRMHPATRTFMALRIAVNGELDALDRLLEAIPTLLRPGGRAAVISFHSLEDRRVKRAFAALKDSGGFTLVTRKPVTPSPQEQADNPRSRSAKLRVIERNSGGTGGTGDA